MSLSVVTVCFNNVSELQKTCQSVDKQLVLPDEHWIIDASTQTQIKNWLTESSQPSYRKWICEPDRGISDGFNKGITSSKSEVIHLLNSGDLYFSEKSTLWAMETFAQNPKIGWLHGQMLVPRGGIKVVVGSAFEKSKLYKGMRTLNHPTFFVKKSLYQKHGLFSLYKKFAMDYDFLVRIADEPSAYCPRVLVEFEGGGISEQKIRQSLKEVISSYETRFGWSPKCRLWALRTEFLFRLTQKNPLFRTIFRLKNHSKRLIGN
jgi:hypothetical protein